MAKVVHLTTAHPAYDVRIFHKECRSLAAHGHDVTLIAPAARDTARYGVSIRALPPPRQRLHRMTLTAWRAFRLARAEHADIYHFHDPELIPVGIALTIFGARVVYDVHEDLPLDVENKPWIPRGFVGFVSGLSRFLEPFAARFFAGVAAATPEIASRFRRHRVALVRNFPDVALFAHHHPLDYGKRRNVAVYVGGLSEVRGLNVMVRAVASLPAALAPTLLLAGAFSDGRNTASIRGGKGSSRVEYRGWLRPDEVVSLLGEARVGLALLKPTRSFRESLPTKLFEYMAAGIPIVASDFPTWREIIEDARCGYLVSSGDEQGAVRAIQKVFEHPHDAQMMGARGREAIQKKYNWDCELAKLLQLYEQILSAPSAKTVRQ